MRKLVEKVFRRYGVPITVEGSSGYHSVYGFVRHTATSANKHLLPEYTPLGELPQGHYLIMLPRNVVSVGNLLMYNDVWHIVRRVERVWLGKSAVYDWCLCEERGEVDTWGR